jgi:hypothetical protein
VWRQRVELDIRRGQPARGIMMANVLQQLLEPRRVSEAEYCIRAGGLRTLMPAWRLAVLALVREDRSGKGAAIGNVCPGCLKEQQTGPVATHRSGHNVAT